MWWETSESCTRAQLKLVYKSSTAELQSEVLITSSTCIKINNHPSSSTHLQKSFSSSASPTALPASYPRTSKSRPQNRALIDEHTLPPCSNSRLSFTPTPLNTMGRLRRSRAHHARRDIHRAARTRARPARDLDQIQLIDLEPEVRCLSFPFVFTVLCLRFSLLDSLIESFLCISSGFLHVTMLYLQVLTIYPLQKRSTLEAQPLNHELPGLGQHYCVECARYVYFLLS